MASGKADSVMSQEKNTAGDLSDPQIRHGNENSVELEFMQAGTSASTMNTTTINGGIEKTQPSPHANPPPAYSEVMLNVPQNNEINNAPPEVRDFMAKKFYCVRPGAFSHAVDDIKKCIDPELDGRFVGAWLLTEIDHWNHEKERLVVLTQFQLFVVKYDFVALRIDKCRRVSLKSMDKIQSVGFIMPDKSLNITNSVQVGLRIYIDKSRVMTTWQRWNPLYTDVPYIIFYQHKVANLLEKLSSEYIYENFKQALLNNLTVLGVNFEATLASIEEEIYVGALSVVHNQSDLGFSKDRGAASF